MVELRTKKGSSKDNLLDMVKWVHSKVHFKADKCKVISRIKNVSNENNSRVIKDNNLNMNFS